MSEIINFTRLTTSDKLPDKFVTCQAYIPQDKDQAERGQVFSHLEINTPWFPTSQVGQTIINTLIKEYYRGNDSSDLVNFEEAIKKVNESLAQTAQSGETEWIGKLSGVLVLINKSEIHFAQTGSSHSYLYRSGKINHITEGLENDEAPHPLKTFSNLTSGTLQEGDRVIVANNAFFEVINPNELKLIISSLPPTLAAIESAKILQNHGAQDANAIFFELTNLERLADLPPEQKLEAIYLDQQIASLSGVGRNILSNFSKAAARAFKKSANSVSKFSQHTTAIASKITHKKPGESANATDNDQAAIDFDTEESQIETSIEKENHQPFMSRLFTNFIKSKNKIRRFLIQVGFYTRKKSKLYLGLLVCVLVVLALTIFLTASHKNSSQKAAQANTTYNQIIAASGEADVLFSTNQIEALKKYNQVINLTEQLTKTKYFDEANKLSAKAKEHIQSVAKLSAIDAKHQIKLENINSIALSDKNIYAISGSDLYSKDLGGANFVKIAALGIESSHLAYSIDTKLLTAISKNQLISFESNGSALNPTGIVFSSAQNIKAFGSNLYTTDIADNKLYKISYSDGNFKDRSDYLKDSFDIKNIADFAIDGSVYTLDKDGTITRFSRGNKLGDFKVALPTQENIGEFSALYTTESATDLLVMAKVSNSWRLIDIRKNGDFLKQYELKGLNSPVTGITDATNTKFYVINNDAVLSFELAN